MDCKTCGDRGTMPPPTTEEKDRGRTFYPCPDCDPKKDAQPPYDERSESIERIVEEAANGIADAAWLGDGVAMIKRRDLVPILRAALRKAQREAVPCPECRGSVAWDEKMPPEYRCPTCKGRGKISERLDEVLKLAEWMRDQENDDPGEFMFPSPSGVRDWGLKREEERNG